MRHVRSTTGMAARPKRSVRAIGRGRESKATVNAQGKVSICTSHNPRTDDCGLGNAGVNPPTFSYGHRVTVGRFRCTVLHSGVMCTVIASGKGFLFNPSRAVQVGPISKQGTT
jgi:hypothetical protein